MAKIELLNPQNNSLVAKNTSVGTIFKWILSLDPGETISSAKLSIFPHNNTPATVIIDVPQVAGESSFDISNYRTDLQPNTTYDWSISIVSSAGNFTSVIKSFLCQTIDLANQLSTQWPTGPDAYEYIGSKVYFDTLRTNAKTILQYLGQNGANTASLMNQLDTELFYGEIVPSRDDFLLLEAVIHEIELSKQANLSDIDELIFDDLGASDIHVIYQAFEKVTLIPPPRPLTTIYTPNRTMPAVINIQQSATGSYDGLPGSSVASTTKEGKSDKSIDYPPTVLYDDGTYSGTLPQKGAPTFKETRMEPPADTIPVSNSREGTSSSSSAYPATNEYSVNGYVGTLTKTGNPEYVRKDGTPDKTKDASGSREGTSSVSSSYAATIPYSDGEGFSGTLSRNGSPTWVRDEVGASDTKSVTASSGFTIVQGWQASGSSWVTDGSAEYQLSDSYSYNSGGYVGTLPRTGYKVDSAPKAPTIPVKGSGGSATTYGSGTQSFAGSATKPGQTQAIYSQSYAGTVKKPGDAVDIYKQNYSGNATKPGTPVNYYLQKYEGVTDKIHQSPGTNDISWNLAPHDNASYRLNFSSSLEGISHGKMQYKYGYDDSFYEAELYYPSAALVSGVTLPTSGYTDLFAKSTSKKQRETISLQVIDGYNNFSEAGSYVYTHQNDNLYLMEDWEYEIEYLRASLTSDPMNLPTSSNILQDWTPLYRGKLQSYKHTVISSAECYYYYRIRGIDASGATTPFQTQFPAVVLKSTNSASNLSMPNVLVLSKNSTSVTLGWSQVVGATSYNYRMNNGSIQSTTNLGVTFSGLQPNTAYTFYVQATNALKASDWTVIVVRTNVV
jgi:hypothetical protein